MAVEERGRLVGVARRDAQVVGDAHVADEDALVEQGLPRGLLVAEATEEDEVAVAGDGARAELGEPLDDAVALVLDDLDGAEHDVRVLEGDAGDRLGRAAQVVGQPDEAQRVDELGCRDEVAETSAGEGERLAHGPRHDEPWVLGEERQARIAFRGGRTRRRPRRRRRSRSAPRRGPHR